MRAHGEGESCERNTDCEGFESGMNGLACCSGTCQRKVLTAREESTGDPFYECPIPAPPATAGLNVTEEDHTHGYCAEQPLWECHNDDECRHHVASYIVMGNCINENNETAEEHMQSFNHSDDSSEAHVHGRCSNMPDWECIVGDDAMCIQRHPVHVVHGPCKFDANPLTKYEDLNSTTTESIGAPKLGDRTALDQAEEESEATIKDQQDSVRQMEDAIRTALEEGRSTGNLEEEKQATLDREKEEKAKQIQRRLDFCDEDVDCKNCVRTRSKLGYPLGHINQCYSCDIECRECVEYRTEMGYHPATVAACHGGYFSWDMVTNNTSDEDGGDSAMTELMRTTEAACHSSCLDIWGSEPARIEAQTAHVTKDNEPKYDVTHCVPECVSCVALRQALGYGAAEIESCYSCGPQCEECVRNELRKASHNSSDDASRAAITECYNSARWEDPLSGKTEDATLDIARETGADNFQMEEAGGSTGGLSPGAIAGIVIGSFIGVLLLMLLVALCYMRRDKIKRVLKDQVRNSNRFRTFEDEDGGLSSSSAAAAQMRGRTGSDLEMNAGVVARGVNSPRGSSSMAAGTGAGSVAGAGLSAMTKGGKEQPLPPPRPQRYNEQLDRANTLSPEEEISHV